MLAPLELGGVMTFSTLTARFGAAGAAGGRFWHGAGHRAGAAPGGSGRGDNRGRRATPDAAETDIMKDVDVDNLDWSQLNVDASTLNLAPAKGRAAAKGPADSGAAWSSSLKGNGASSVSVKQSVFPFWDARVGADMTVVNPNAVATSADLLRQKYAPTPRPRNPRAPPGPPSPRRASARCGTRPPSKPASIPARSRASSAPPSANRCRSASNMR